MLLKYKILEYFIMFKLFGKISNKNFLPIYFFVIVLHILLILMIPKFIDLILIFFVTISIFFIIFLLNSIISYNLNEYISVNRFTGYLSMRVDINIKDYEKLRKELNLTRDKLFVKMFIKGIYEIPKISKYKLPFLFFKNRVKVKTNAAIFQHVQRMSHFYSYKDLGLKRVFERAYFLKTKQLIALLFYRKKNKNKYSHLYKLCNTPVKRYYIEIKIENLNHKI